MKTPLPTVSTASTTVPTSSLPTGHDDGPTGPPAASQFYTSAHTSTGPLVHHGTLGPLRLPALDAHDEAWLELLARIGAGHGRAVTALARFLTARGHSTTTLAAVTLAADLLDGQPPHQLENLVVLLGDGWEQSLAQLFDCARSL